MGPLYSNRLKHEQTLFSQGFENGLTKISRDEKLPMNMYSCHRLTY